MKQLFLAAELLDLVIAESEQDFHVLEIFRKLVDNGLISRDAVIIVTSSIADGHCEKIEVTGLRWDRIRRHEFVSYVDYLHNRYRPVGYGAQAPSKAPSSGNRRYVQTGMPQRLRTCFPSQAPCVFDRCWEDGICRRQGVDLISPCTTDS